MIYTVKDIRREVPHAFLNDKWVIARPINWKYRSLKQRLYEAWCVFIGTADAFKWPEGQ